MKILLAGIEIHLTGEGMAHIPSLNALCAADLHFEKGSFFTRFATFLPPYDSDDTLTRLEAAVTRYRPTRFIALGDSFHDIHAAERLRPDLVERLNILIKSVEDWQWITGNHDPDIDHRIAGHRCESLASDGMHFVHVKSTISPVPELSGHYHPKTSVSLRGHFIRAPCFVQQGIQLILPSFGKFTGGLDVNSEAFIRQVPQDGRKLYLLHAQEVFKVA